MSMFRDDQGSYLYVAPVLAITVAALCAAPCVAIIPIGLAYGFYRAGKADREARLAAAAEAFDAQQGE